MDGYLVLVWEIGTVLHWIHFDWLVEACWFISYAFGRSKDGLDALWWESVMFNTASTVIEAVQSITNVVPYADCVVIIVVVAQ